MTSLRINLLGKKQRSLAGKIFIDFSFLIVGLFLILGAFALRYAYTSIMENQANELRIASVGLTQLITRQFHRGEATLRAAGNEIVVKNYLNDEAGGTELKRVTSELTRRVGPARELLSLSLYDLNGLCVSSSRPELDGYTAIKDDFFQKGLKAFHFIEIFKTPKSEKIQLIAMPVRNGAKVIGVIAGQINLSHLYELMDQKLGISESSEAFLVDHKLRFVTPGKSGSTLLSPSHIKASMAQKAAKESFLVANYDNNKSIEVLGTIAPLKEFNWYLVIETPFREVRESLFSVVSALFGAGLFLLSGTLWLSRTIARRVSQPIEMLSWSAKNISTGDLTTPVTVTPGSLETEFLAAELESMRIRLADARIRLTEKLEVSEKLRIESERLAAIGTLASTLAHEIRNPLNALSLLISKTQGQVSGQDAPQKTLASMRGEIERLEKLVGSILDYARPLPLDRRKTDLGKVVTDVAEFYRPLAEDSGLQIIVKISGSDLTASFDQDQIKQSLANLVQNALDSMRGSIGKQLTIAVSREIGYLSLEVIDTGMGIEEKSRPRIFDLFYTTKANGTGLGLSTVRKIINAHGGEINLAPNPSGPGAVATIKLPD